MQVVYIFLKATEVYYGNMSYAGSTTQSKYSHMHFNSNELADELLYSCRTCWRERSPLVRNNIHFEVQERLDKERTIVERVHLTFLRTYASTHQKGEMLFIPRRPGGQESAYTCESAEEAHYILLSIP